MKQRYSLTLEGTIPPLDGEPRYSLSFDYDLRKLIPTTLKDRKFTLYSCFDTDNVAAAIITGYKVSINLPSPYNVCVPSSDSLLIGLAKPYVFSSTSVLDGVKLDNVKISQTGESNGTWTQAATGAANEADFTNFDANVTGGITGALETEHYNKYTYDEHQCLPVMIDYPDLSRVTLTLTPYDNSEPNPEFNFVLRLAFELLE